MIETLRIENLAVVKQAELEFGPGLNVLTGETGAGKSIVLGALSLLAGGRASPDLIRDGAEEAVVEAVFRAEASELAQELERRGLGAGDTLVVRRTLTRSGRGRVRVAGELVPVATLAELFAGRLEISSQHESQRLLRPEAQGRILDAFGGLLDLRREVADGLEALRTLDTELGALRARAEELARREDFLQFQVREIDEAQIKKGEFEELGALRRRLAHAERLSAEAEQAARALAGDATGSAEWPCALDQLGDAARRVAALTGLDPALEALAARLEGLRTELDDVARELEGYGSGIDAEPGRLAEVEERLALLERLRRKYGPEDEILRFRDEAAAELATLAGADERGTRLAAEREQTARRVADAAARLSAGRSQAACRLAGVVEQRLRELAMPEASFEIALVPADPPVGLPCGPAGAEAAEFGFSANPGEPLAPLRRVASGGELSRVFLAVKSALRRADAGMVLVFDEVDAGIGGRVADRVGRVLAELAGEHQVLCITHLPQIAARAEVHFRVDKQVRRSRTAASVHRLAGDARVDEIARMAGGEKVGEATRRHARELLRASRP